MLIFLKIGTISGGFCAFGTLFWHPFQDDGFKNLSNKSKTKNLILVLIQAMKKKKNLMKKRKNLKIKIKIV